MKAQSIYIVLLSMISEISIIMFVFVVCDAFKISILLMFTYLFANIAVRNGSLKDLNVSSI